MDELEFNIDPVSNTDANLEVEGYEEQIEDIQNRYPEEDYRTPAQQELDLADKKIVLQQKLQQLHLKLLKNQKHLVLTDFKKILIQD